MKYKRSLFIFRRDLRLEDNTGLIQALKDSQEVIPCFIFDPRQVDDNPYKSSFALSFMIEALSDLNQQLNAIKAKLYFFYDQPEKIVEKLLKKENVDAVYVNRDYTPFSIQRDLSLNYLCQKHNKSFHSFDDALLFSPEEVKKNDGGVYTIFTPFYNKVQEFEVRSCPKNRFRNYFKKELSLEDESLLEIFKRKYSQSLIIEASRKYALKILKRLSDFKNYDLDRNFPEKEATTYLSAHHKFGTVSIREVYHAIKDQFGLSHTLIKELFWRDFFTHIGFHYPHVLTGCFYSKYDRIQWQNDIKKFEAWCEGKTGFPIVDAGIRELNSTGFMHNRVRMITASFLVKDLHINWRWGEKYFAQHLIDYDPLVNNGNWQWAASTGCDAQPYFRIFNPWLQQKKYDPQCLYIKTWIPELKNVSADDIHDFQSGKSLFAKDYPMPIVDHAQVSSFTKSLFSRLN